jgi:membrane-bound ClpP family serine protease
MINNTRELPPAWQDRVRDPSLTTLFVLVVCAMFVAEPLAAKGLPIARTVADTLVFTVLVIVVMLSHKWSAIILILLGSAAIVASFLANLPAASGLRTAATLACVRAA